MHHKARVLAAKLREQREWTAIDAVNEQTSTRVPVQLTAKR